MRIEINRSIRVIKDEIRLSGIIKAYIVETTIKRNLKKYTRVFAKHIIERWINERI